MRRTFQVIVVIVFIAAFIAAAAVMTTQAPQRQPVLENARRDAPTVFQSLGRMPNAEPLTGITSQEYRMRRSRRIEYEQQYKAEGHFEDAVAWARRELLSKGWHVDEETHVRTMFRRNDSAPASLSESADVRARWFFEIERGAEYRGERPSYIFVVRLKCYV